ncbi:MAG: hypothetical protein K0S22_1974 [Oscillospiraceae bacterium]|nr:hypothetical protein [Oscillospiraceae bacterium]
MQKILLKGEIADLKLNMMVEKDLVDDLETIETQLKQAQHNKTKLRKAIASINGGLTGITQSAAGSLIAAQFMEQAPHLVELVKRLIAH